MNAQDDAQDRHSARPLTRQERVLYAARVAPAREALGITQADLATAAGISRGTVGNIESGETVPQSAVLWRLLGVLEIRPDQSEQWPPEVESWLALMAPMLASMDPSVRERVMVSVMQQLGRALRGEVGVEAGPPRMVRSRSRALGDQFVRATSRTPGDEPAPADRDE